MEQTKYDVFISYSRKDYVDANKNVISGNEVSKIKDALKAAGITYWFDEEGVYSGNEFAEIIVRSIKASRVFVFLSTQNANQSEWTASEISTANMLKKKIIPVRIDDSVYHDSVILYISRLSHIDYHDNPEKGRKELIRSIKSYLNEEKRAEEQKIEEEKLRLRSLELQRQVQEEEKCRQAKIAKIETDIAALETQLSKCKRTILDKEHELRLAQEDYDVCDAKIKKLKDKIDELKNKGTELVSKIAKDDSNEPIRHNADIHKLISTLLEEKDPAENVRFYSNRKFKTKAEVFQYVKANSLYPASLSNSFKIESAINWNKFATKLNREYGIWIDRRGIDDIKGLVNSIWTKSKEKP